MKNILQSKRLYLDGAMGSQLQEKLSSIGLIPEELNLTNPQVIKEIHQAYRDAGANILLSSTFGANSYKLKSSAYTVSQIVTAAVENVKAVKPDYVGLDIGPIGALIGSLGDIDFEEAVSIFKEVIVAGQTAGVDLIVIETITDISEARAAVIAAKEVSDLPIIVSMTYEENGRTLTGSDPLTVVNILQGMGVDVIGINCSTGPQGMMPIIRDLLEYASVPIMVEPNAGLPKMIGDQTRYDIDADQFAAFMKEIAEMGATHLGGCCGTTPEHISKMIAATKDIELSQKNGLTFTAASSASKTEFLGEDVLVIGESINPTTNELLKDSLKQGQLNIVSDLAISQKKDGAKILDINLGLPGIDEKDLMLKAVDTVTKLVDLPLQIDSSNPEVIAAVLRSYPGRAIINSVNGKKSSIEAILPLAKKYGALVLGLTMDEGGIPDSVEKRLEIAEKIISAGKNYGLATHDFLVDCLVLTASAQQKEVKETLNAVSVIRSRYGIPTVLGVSNISFGLPNRELLNRTFLTMALNQGLTNPIMNPSDREMMDTISAFRALWGYDKQCIAYANTYKEVKAPEIKISTEKVSLKMLIEEGQSDKAKKMTEKLLETKDPMEIVNEQIIPGLDAVGDAFETGEVFLPHLMFAAETAQKAFEAIKEKMAREGTVQVSKGKIILATVEGDVHDIGKNILKVILENYGYSVFDLGKDVGAEAILEVVQSENISLVGLSALMTTTVRSMKNIIEYLREKAANITIMVGGAVLTPEYAKEIGADFYGKDAREGVTIARKVFEQLS
ncbi:homocysteine S-methyltransferase family protein [Eubacteriaceae bacterium ES2]|nr:homocysteine S-methyltransferase family protein [Eubacteriaceae bacterium ES2]